MLNGTHVETENSLPSFSEPKIPERGAILENKEERASEHHYCVFRSGRERYCLSVREVEEVVEWPVLTKVPLAPPFLMGIFNLRGVIVPVLDIAYPEDRRSDVPPTRLVVAAWRGEADRDSLRVGLAADEILGIRLTSEPLLVEESPRDVLHCRGMLRHDNRLALALDLRHLAEAFPIPII